MGKAEHPGTTASTLPVCARRSPTNYRKLLQMKQKKTRNEIDQPIFALTRESESVLKRVRAATDKHTYNGDTRKSKVNT